MDGMDRNVEQIDEILRRLERRDWWLWSTAIIVSLLLTTAVVSTALPAIRTDPDDFFRYNLNRAVGGLVGLVLLFNIHAVYQQVLIKRFRRKLAEQMIVEAGLRTRAEELEKIAIFDPTTEMFSAAESTAHGRWYPTLTELGDGRIMTTSGLDENGNVNNTSEIYSAGWGPEIPGNPSGFDPSFVFNFSLYPRMHLLPTGQVFLSAPLPETLIFDPTKQTWAFLAGTIYGEVTGSRFYGSSVLLPMTPENNSASSRRRIWSSGW